MISFVDGPARGEHLLLRRAPYYLRVVRSANGRWDGLDQLTDHPEPTESIYLYQRLDKPTVYFVDFRDKRGRRQGHAGQAARYRFAPVQPTDDVMRSVIEWRAWCEAHAPAEVAS